MNKLLLKYILKQGNSIIRKSITFFNEKELNKFKDCLREECQSDGIELQFGEVSTVKV